MGDGWFFRYIKSKNVKSMRYKNELASKICSHNMKYVTESKGENGDTVIGRDCLCRVSDGYFTVTDGNAKLIFRTKMTDIKLFELMSLDGAVISGPDEISGEEKEITAHYSYYR
ncbi:MAG: hypothetical protein IJT49_07315 [Clostridia bacterium]|nr:hypothetical protein [Clostridia bacterium]